MGPAHQPRGSILDANREAKRMLDFVGRDLSTDNTETRAVLDWTPIPSKNFWSVRRAETATSTHWYSPSAFKRSLTFRVRESANARYLLFFR